MYFLESIFWLAMNLYHEARGEPISGQVAVAHVVLNRAKTRGLTVKEVVLQRKQFSWANDGARPAVAEYEALLQCFESAMIALNERLEGKTLKNADHYHAKSVSPSWARSMKVVAEIGDHIFYRS